MINLRGKRERIKEQNGQMKEGEKGKDEKKDKDGGIN